jgi:tetraacyldisaccharide 4'-kinase
MYGRVARYRRAWYGRHPDRIRRLARPVVSVGNLVVGGSGKTPLVASLARLLLDADERPSILSRGYRRRQAADGVVVVSDGRAVQVGVEASGDEPQMLARALPGVPVLVSPDRFLSGCLAERRFGCTVHVLDDGFQHLQLARDVNLLVLATDDLNESMLPTGRLREPLEAASAADAVLVFGDAADAGAIASRVGVAPIFTVAGHQGEPRLLAGDTRSLPTGRRVIAVAGIARPHRFFDGLRAAQCDVAREIVFGDHHWFSPRDVARVCEAAAHHRADLVVTTEKDGVRIPANALPQSRVPWAAVPLHVSVDPAFAPWLRDRLAAARGRGDHPGVAA